MPHLNVYRMNFKTKQEEAKHQEERMIARLLLQELGYEPNALMSGESPDLIVPDRNSGKIGIEVTKLSLREDEEDFACFQDIIDEYAKQFDKKKLTSDLYQNNMPYTLRVYLHGAMVPHIKGCKRKKTQIISELDSCLFPISGMTYDREYIACVTPWDTPNISASKATVSFVEQYRNIDEKLLYDRIGEKEERLKKYKIKIENSNIKEYYLLIYISEIYQIDIRGFKLPCTFISDYDRIYLTRGADLIQINI